MDKEEIEEIRDIALSKIEELRDAAWTRLDWINDNLGYHTVYDHIKAYMQHMEMYCKALESERNILREAYEELRKREEA
jgi:hypothetical protein